MFSSQATTIGSILLALCFLLNSAYGDDEIEVIAYRTVSNAEGEWINENGRLYRDKALDFRDVVFSQIGHGFYAVNTPGDWEEDDADQYYCVLEANMTKIKEVGKIWIPESYESTILWTNWGGIEDTVLQYIGSTNIPDPRKALRFSYIGVDPNKMQMVIPTDTINENELDIRPQCWKEEKDLLEYSSEVVDWTEWEISGTPDTTGPTPVSDFYASHSRRRLAWYRRLLRAWRSWVAPPPPPPPLPLAAAAA